MPNRSSDDFDNDHTDELPVLLETVTFEDDEALFASSQVDDTSEQTALHKTVAEKPASATPALPTDSAERQARVADLEAQNQSLAERNRELELHLAQKDQLIEELKHEVATFRDSANDASAAERRLATQLAVHDARIAELTTTVEHLERDAAAGATEVERLRTSAATAQHEADTLKGELAARPAASEPTADLQQLLEEKATLEAYIAARRTWWEEAQVKQIGLEAKVTALQHELTMGSKRLGDAEAFAARESSRAVALRAELVDAARRLSTLERELRALRAANTPAPASASEAPPDASSGDRNDGQREPMRAAPSSDFAAASRAAQDPQVGMDGIGAAAPAVEAVAQLEAEVEYKRQQVAAQLVELRDREQQLRAGTNEMERVRRELAAIRNELDESRVTAARLERAVIDKDRALEARDTRIVTLQEEIKQRVGNGDKVGAGGSDSAAPKREPPPVRAGPIEPSADNVTGPALICLTGDAPKRFPLTKTAVTIGRGPQCDLQILTHFVSREHARITSSAGRILIEDAGSRNGVFVNSVRVERQALQQGDLITIGDTQFRFVESMAH